MKIPSVLHLFQVGIVSALSFPLCMSCSKHLVTAESSTNFVPTDDLSGFPEELNDDFLEADMKNMVIKLPMKEANHLEIVGFNIKYLSSQITEIEAVNEVDKVQGQIQILANKNNDSFSIKINIDGSTRNGTAQMDGHGDLVTQTITGDLAKKNSQERQMFDFYLKTLK